MGSNKSKPSDPDGLFQLPEMLDKIFSYLNMEDLKSCRQVNELWNSVAVEKLRPRVKVKLLPVVSCISEFLEFQDNAATMDHSIIELRSFEFKAIPNKIKEEELYEQVLKLFTTFGKDIKSLTILGGYSSYRYASFSKLFSYCPNLVSLSCSPCIVGITDGRDYSKLTSLELVTAGETAIGESDILRLSAMNLKLIKFSILIGSNMPVRLLHCLLNNMKESLQVLSVYWECNNYYDDWDKNFPILPVLTSLTTTFLLLYTTDFAEKFPLLNHLKLQRNMHQRLGEDMDLSVVNPTLGHIESLTFNLEERFECYAFELMEKELQMFIILNFSLCPLRRVEFEGEDETLLLIYKIFPNLEELIVFNSRHITARGFTGMSEEDSLERFCQPWSGMHFSRRAILELEQAGYIGTLKSY